MTTALTPQLVGEAFFMSALVLLGCVFAFAITLAFEMAVAGLYRVGDRGLRAVVLVNLTTNPLVVLMAYIVGVPRGWPVWSFVALVEIIVVLTEWLLLRWALGATVGGPGRLLLLSVSMNAASVLGPLVVGWTYSHLV